MLQWQAPTVLSTHKSNGTKDQLASHRLFREPLMSYLPDGTLIPTLAAEVPSIGNGVADDLTSVTYKLKPGVSGAMAPLHRR